MPVSLWTSDKIPVPIPDFMTSTFSYYITWPFKTRPVFSAQQLNLVITLVSNVYTILDIYFGDTWVYIHEHETANEDWRLC